MSRKTLLLQKNLPATVSFSVTESITSNATQHVTFSPSSDAGLQLVNKKLTLNKNTSSDSLVLTGVITGSYDLKYKLDADYTNQKIAGNYKVYVTDPAGVTNGFQNINGCVNMLFAKEGSDYRDGSIVAYYTSPDASAHTVSISSNSNEEYTVFAVDPAYKTYIIDTVSRVATINVTSQGLWQFVPAHDFIVNVSGNPVMVPEGSFRMTADSVECCGAYAFYQGISYLPVNSCNIPNP